MTNFTTHNFILVKLYSALKCNYFLISMVMNQSQIMYSQIPICIYIYFMSPHCYDLCPICCIHIKYVLSMISMGDEDI